MFNSTDQHAYVTQLLPKSHQISPIPHALRDYAPQTLPRSTEDRTLEPQQWQQSSIPKHWAFGRQKGEGVLTTDTRYGYGDTAIREFKKRHSGSIERVSEYRSIEVSDTQVSDTGTAGLVKYR